MLVTLLDSGPLVAYLNRRDRWHDWTVTQFSRIRPPLFTCEAALAESSFLIQRTGLEAGVIIELLKRAIFQIAISVQTESSSILQLMSSYRNVPMSLADACLVRMSELYPDSQIFTLDSDFRTYRRNRRQKIELLAPWAD